MVHQAESDVSYSPLHWIEQASKLNILMYREDMIYAEIAHQLAKKRAELIVQTDENGKAYTGKKVDILVEATDEYLRVRKMQLKRERAIQQIMLSKKYSDRASEELRTQM